MIEDKKYSNDFQEQNVVAISRSSIQALKLNLPEDFFEFNFKNPDDYGDRNGRVLLPKVDTSLMLDESSPLMHGFGPTEPIALMPSAEYEKAELNKIIKEMDIAETGWNSDVYNDRIGANIIDAKDEFDIEIFFNPVIDSLKYIVKAFVWKQVFRVAWPVERLLMELNFDDYSRKLGNKIIEKEQETKPHKSFFRLCPYCVENRVDTLMLEPDFNEELIAVCSSCQSWILNETMGMDFKGGYRNE